LGASKEELFKDEEVWGASKEELFKDEEVLGASEEVLFEMLEGSLDLILLVTEPLAAFPRASLIIC